MWPYNILHDVHLLEHMPFILLSFVCSSRSKGIKTWGNVYTAVHFITPLFQLLLLQKAEAASYTLTPCNARTLARSVIEQQP